MGSDGGDPRLAAIAGLVADGSRAAICAVLLDGRYRTAAELARCARVSEPAASEHLSSLVAGGLLDVTGHGRRRYFRLAGPEVAATCAALARLPPAIPIRPPRQGTASQALRAGRTCYDHLAGQLGVALTEQLIAGGVITAGFKPGDLSPLAPLGLSRLAASSRPAVRPCLDWTERRHHAAGALPAALTSRLLELGWLNRPAPGQRAVRLTGRGRAGLADLLGTAGPVLTASASAEPGSP
jgi:DNA-binding transcriptional ArsR family regulator